MRKIKKQIYLIYRKLANKVAPDGEAVYEASLSGVYQWFLSVSLPEADQ